MTLTLTINNNQVIQGDAQQIAEFLQITERMGTISNTITTPVTNTQTETVSETEPEELEEFDVFISSILKDYFKESYVERIVSKLSEISEKIINHEFIDFRSARGLYWNFAYTLQENNILKVIFAAYKIKTSSIMKCTYSQGTYSAISKIRSASACSECGGDAAKIRNRLVEEGYLPKELAL